MYRERERQRDIDTHICICVYIYIERERHPSSEGRRIIGPEGRSQESSSRDSIVYSIVLI